MNTPGLHLREDKVFKQKGLKQKRIGSTLFNYRIWNMQNYLFSFPVAIFPSHLLPTQDCLVLPSPHHSSRSDTNKWTHFPLTQMALPFRTYYIYHLDKKLVHQNAWHIQYLAFDTGLVRGQKYHQYIIRKKTTHCKRKALKSSKNPNPWCLKCYVLLFFILYL